ncbi:ESX secretion-associated protein EspG [Amycolatopsis anabasis]|uniref:ESX secretion-associated protein EspG n=1 Tax=Amycolatopsis anabasis TaxID=1840409 RepID=UPI00131BA80B|nr:ESX secretion-associated protein EspG [Amycolatopsis anabasis]
MAYSFSLSLAAVDMLLEQAGTPRAPFPFQVPHIGTTHDQRAQVREAVFDDLRTRGLMRGQHLEDDVDLALRTFARSPIAITAAAQLESDGKRLFARACSDGQYAVVVRQDENLLVFEEARPTGIVPAIVDLLPLTPAAPGQSVTIAQPAAQPVRGPRSDEGYDPFAGVAAPRSHGGGQLRMVERIFEKPKKRVGQFTVFVPGAMLDPTAWFDTEDGRYFMTLREAPDGQTWITYAPADNARIAQHLYAQLEGHL